MTKQEIYIKASELADLQDLWIQERSKEDPCFTWNDYCVFEDAAPLDVTNVLYAHVHNYYDGDMTLQDIASMLYSESELFA